MAEIDISNLEELDCFKKCKELRVLISDIVKTFPTNEQFRLLDQMYRCSRSITNNIAEGYGRFHFKENAQFYRQSRGSLYELMDHIQIALEEKYIDTSIKEKLFIQINTCLRILNGYINYLINQANLNKTNTNNPLTTNY